MNPEWGKVRPGLNDEVLHRLYFVRHGESTANLALMNHAKDKPETPVLTELGKVQAEKLAAYFHNNVEIDEILTSPMHRAFSTCAPTASLFPLVTPNTLDILREKGKNGDESEEAFRQRVAEIVKIITTAKGPRQTVIFSHSLLLSTVLKTLLGAKDSAAMFHLSNGSISVVDIGRDRIHVQVVNYTNHLGDDTSGQHVKL